MMLISNRQYSCVYCRDKHVKYSLEALNNEGAKSGALNVELIKITKSLEKNNKLLAQLVEEMQKVKIYAREGHKVLQGIWKYVTNLYNQLEDIGSIVEILARRKGLKSDDFIRIRDNA